jgi:hypothetical protein
VLYGTSQGGYWVPRAAAFEHRLAALIADPGVVDVSTSRKDHIPTEMVALLEGEDETGFTAAIELASSEMSPAMQQQFAWRAKPYRDQPSVYATFKTAEQYRLGDLVNNIKAPSMITDPEGEQCRSSVIRILHPKMGPVTLADATGDDRCTINATDNARSSRRLTSTASISASCPIIHAVPSISRTATALGTSQQARQRREPQARDFCYA